MPLTKSWTEKVIPVPTEPVRYAVPQRRSEFVWLLLASVIVATGLSLVYQAKTQNYAEIDAKLARNELLNLNAVTSSDQLLPFLRFERDDVARAHLADKIYQAISHSRPIRNVGTLSTLRRQGLPLSKLKPLFVVRTPREFRSEFLKWSGI